MSSNRSSTTTPSWMKVTIKLTIGQHVRRIPVSRILLQGQKSPTKTNEDGPSQSPSIELLRQLALSFHWEEQQLLKKNAGTVEEEYQVVFTYQDEEGDTIYVSSDIELMEALQYSSCEEEDKISFLRVTANVTPLSEILLEQSFFEQNTSQTVATGGSPPMASRTESTEECVFRQATESHHFTNQTIQTSQKDDEGKASSSGRMNFTAAAMLNHHETVKRSSSSSTDGDDEPKPTETKNGERAHATDSSTNFGRSSSTNSNNGGGSGGVANHLLSKAEEIVLCLRKEVEEVATAAAAAAPTDIRPPPCIRKLQRKFSAAKQREWELERERLKKHYPKPNGDEDEDTVASDASGTAGVAAAAATGGGDVAAPDSNNENDKSKKEATATTKKAATSSSSSSTFDPRFVHPRHQCDMCHVFPIRGFRWRAVRPKQPPTNEETDATTVAADADAAATKKTKPEYVEMNFDLCHRCYVTWREQKDDVVDARSSKRYSSIHNMKLPDGVKFRPVQLELDRLYHLKRHSHQERLRQEGKNVHLDMFMRELNSKSSHVAQVVMKALNDLPKEAKSRARFGYQRGVAGRGGGRGRYCGRNNGGRSGPREDEFYIDLVHCPEVNEGILKSLSQLSQKREDAKRAAAGTEPLTVEVEATVLNEPLISEDPETAAAAGANANPTTTTLSLEDGSTLVATAVSGLDCGTHDASQCALVDVVVPTKTTDDEEEDHLAQSSLTFGSSATSTREVVVVPPPPPVSSVAHSTRNDDEPSAMTADDHEEEQTNASSHSRSEEKDEGDDEDVDNKDEEPVTIVSSVASSRATDHASDASASSVVIPPTEEMLQLSLGASALNDSVLLGIDTSSMTLPSSSSSSMYHSAVEGSPNSTDNSSTVEAAEAAETSPTKTDETTTNTSSDKNTSDVVTETRKNNETNDDSKTEQEVDSNNNKDDRKNDEHVDNNNNNTTNVNGATTTIDMSTVGCDDDDLESIEEQEETAAVESAADDYKAIVVLSDDDADAAWILEDNDDEEEDKVNNNDEESDDDKAVVVDREEEEENDSNDDHNDLPILEGYPSSADEASASETADDWDLLDSSSDDDDDSDSEIFARATQSIGSSLFSQGSGGNQK